MSWKTRNCYIEYILETKKCLLEYVFVKHLNFSKLVYRLKTWNFVGKGIAKKSHRKLSKILERATLQNQWGETFDLESAFNEIARINSRIYWKSIHQGGFSARSNVSCFFVKFATLLKPRYSIDFFVKIFFSRQLIFGTCTKNYLWWSSQIVKSHSVQCRLLLFSSKLHIRCSFAMSAP